MLMTEYETTLVIRPDLSGDMVENTLDRVRDVVNNDGKLLEITHWGKRKLAYEVARHSRGIYVHTHYLGSSNLVAELERNLRISDNVLRFLTVRLEAGVNPDNRQIEEYVRPEYDVEEQAACSDDAAQGGGSRSAPPAEEAGSREKSASSRAEETKTAEATDETPTSSEAETAAKE